MYKYVPNSVVKISMMFAKYFEYYTIVLMRPFLWTRCIITFSREPYDAKCIVVTRVCVSVCLSAAAYLHCWRITACTVVQAVVKANSQSNGNGQISTPRGSKTP